MESCCTPAALVLGEVLTFKSSKHLYMGLPLKDFPSQYTTAIHLLWLSPHPACSLLPCIILLPLCALLSSPHAQAQLPLLHALLGAKEMPFSATEHLLLSCCLIRLSTHLSVLSYPYPLTYTHHSWWRSWSRTITYPKATAICTHITALLQSCVNYELELCCKAGI